MKKILWLVIFLSSTALGQPVTECQLMRQRISGQSGSPDICSALYQLCAEKAMQSVDKLNQQNQCSMGFGHCQMGGALSGEALEDAIEQYKNKCEKIH
ncbi:hypothetical protein G6646_03530 [Polynucleobacter paneuropaeus]|jgi:hypothetical protein|nr:hypothetical protein [Polynucleobacter paneuropaeus]MBT8604853.1 hypothetical protein [Polynucleobacter paneuropaeus]